MRVQAPLVAVDSAQAMIAHHGTMLLLLLLLLIPVFRV
jgi:hypothetical protein